MALYPGTLTYPSSSTFPSASGTVEPVTTIVTLADAKRFAPQPPNMATADYEADLSTVIDAVSAHLARHYGAPLPGTVTRAFSSVGGTIILPLGVTVVTLTNGNVPLTGWHHDSDAGLLRVGYWYGTTVEVTYATPVLPDVREAVLLTVQHAWETRYGANPVPFQSGVDEAYTASRGFFVPNRAKELLMPYGTRVG